MAPTGSSTSTTRSRSAMPSERAKGHDMPATATASWTDHGTHVEVVMTCADDTFVVKVSGYPDVALPAGSTLDDVIATLASEGIVVDKNDPAKNSHYNALIHMAVSY